MVMLVSVVLSYIYTCVHVHPKSNGFFQLVTEQCVHNNKEIGDGTRSCRLSASNRVYILCSVMIYICVVLGLH